jgi:hypothetical protein
VTEELLYRIRKEQAGRVDAAGAEGETSVTVRPVGPGRESEAPVLVASGGRTRTLG